ncbi:pim1 [Symbiodinium natans]|uniref:Pim1 protein n=1 Tax=Symbiodinium natans TaxID=878477 RepID=A0A812SU05_9DINO|nr:pim1 [Symbiodinium natans]
MPVVRDTYNGRTVLEGMLLPQGLEGADMEHVALMEFPDAGSAEAFLHLPEMTDLQKATVEMFETMQLQPRRTWELRWAALKLLARRRLGREPPPQLRSFSKGWNRLLAQQVAQQPAASLAALHFISLGSMDFSRARQAAAEALCEVWRCGGRLQYIASNEREAGCVELLVTRWRSPGQLLRYLRTQALDADVGEDELASAAIEHILICPQPF